MNIAMDGEVLTVTDKGLERTVNEAKLPMNVKLKLYVNRALSAWGDRMWQYAIGFYFIHLYPDSFLVAACHGILSSVAIFVAAPYIGKWIDQTSRLTEIRYSLFIQNGFLAIGSLFFVLNDQTFLSENLRFWIASCGLVFCAVIAQVWSVGYTICLEKDWVVTVAGLNAHIRGIDLICQVTAPILVGFLVDWSIIYSAIFMAVWNIVSATFEYTTLYLVYKSVTSLQEPKKKVSSSFKLFDFDAYKLYIKSFLLPGLAFSLLYLTVLGFDSITVGYASTRGITAKKLSFVSMGCGLVGFLGIVIYPRLVKRLGVANTALVGFLLETTCLTLCLADPADTHIFKSDSIGVILLLVGITLARFGLWTADLGVNQLIQTTTSSPPQVASSQTSLNTLMELVKFVITILMEKFYLTADNDRDHRLQKSYAILVLISYSAVALGTILFGLHLLLKYKTKSIQIN